MHSKQCGMPFFGPLALLSTCRNARTYVPFVEAPETGSQGWGKVQRHQTSSRSTEYQVGVALSCLKVATLLSQLEPVAEVVTQALSVGPM